MIDALNLGFTYLHCEGRASVNTLHLTIMMAAEMSPSGDRL